MKLNVVEEKNIFEAQQVGPSSLICPSFTIVVSASPVGPNSTVELSPPLCNFSKILSLYRSSGIPITAPDWCSSLYLLLISCRDLSLHYSAICALLCAPKYPAFRRSSTSISSIVSYLLVR